MTLERIGDQIKAPRIRDDYRVYNMGGAWGFNITVQAEAAPGRPGMWSREYTHTGCYTPIPRAGDILLIKMQSGKTAVLVFHEVEHWHDPPDGFAAGSLMIGYKDEVKLDYKGVQAL